MADTEDQKPVVKGEDGADGSSEHINLKVKGQDGAVVHFKIKRKTALKKLMEAYCQRQSLQLDQIRFLFDGTRLRDTHTPEELDMEDDDVIDAMLFQVGGL
jgi:small ubiquitin-related modifier